MSSVLDKIYKNSEEVKDRVESIDDTLQRLYKTEAKENKAEDKERKEKALSRKRALRKKKRETADKDKGLFGALKKEEKKKESNFLIDLLKGALSGIGGLLTNAVGLLTSALTSLAAPIAGLLTGALSAIAGIIPGLMATVPALLKGGGIIAAIVASVKGIGNLSRRIGELQGGRGRTKTGTEYTRNDIVGLLNARVTKEGNKGVNSDGELYQQMMDQKTEYVNRSNVTKSLNDQLYKDKRKLENLTNKITKTDEDKKEIKKLSKSIEKKEHNLLQSKRILQRLFEELKVTDKELVQQQITMGNRDPNLLPAHLQNVKFNKPGIGHRLSNPFGYQTYNDVPGRQTGGFTVPGHSTGDNHPYMLPPGSFVLNRNAAQHFQTGGTPNLSPVLLESKEKVLLPGDPMMPMAMMMNDIMPRFQTAQTGGHIVEYLTGEQGHPNYRADHGGQNYHEHLAFQTTAGRDRAMALLKSNGIQIDSVNDGTHAATSYHYTNQAFDVPAHQVPVGEEAKLSQKVRRILKEGGFSGIGGGRGNNSNSNSSFQENMGGIFQGLGNAGIFATTVMGGIGDFLGQKVFGDGFSLSGLFGGIGSMLGMGEGNEPGANRSGTGPVDMGAEIGEKLRRAAQLAMDAGFTKEQAKIMAAIAGGESSFNNTAHNTKGADNSYGLWQINMLGAMGPERRRQLGLSSNDELFDPATNARAAKFIFDRQGFGAWGAYTDGNAGKYMNAAQAMQLQSGGITSVHGNRSSLNKSTEMIRAFGEAIAESVSAEPMVIYQDEPQSSVHVATDSAIHQTPPDISTVPSATPAKHYMFYDLNYGPVV